MINNVAHSTLTGSVTDSVTDSDPELFLPLRHKSLSVLSNVGYNNNTKINSPGTITIPRSVIES